MGVEVHLQSIPPNCKLLDLAREQAEIIGLFWNFEEIKEHCSVKSIIGDHELITKIDKLFLDCLEKHPSLEKRNYSGNRQHDKIWYLLSPNRRNLNFRGSEDNLFYGAIYGEQRLHSSENMYYNPPNTVRSITEYLGSITYDDFGKHYNFKAMKEAGVYKVLHDKDRLSSAWNEFQKIRKLYQEASQLGEGMLTAIE